MFTSCAFATFGKYEHLNIVKSAVD